jgi:protoheme IX farnesyltransferase
VNPPLAPVASPLLDGPAPLPSVQSQYSLASDLSQLTKTRLTTLVLLTTLAGYGLASRGAFDWVRLFHTLLGTTLVAICSSILNQALERDTDALMRRTEQRPLVTRRFPLRGTVAGGLLLGTMGLLELAFFVNSETTVLTALTLAVYVLAYTPLKRLTTLNTLVGAIPGALPPLIGATAARGHFNSEGWTLFAILALWQLPHFYAIAWLYREDYRAAGLRMVSVEDTTGRRPPGMRSFRPCSFSRPAFFRAGSGGRVFSTASAPPYSRCSSSWPPPVSCNSRTAFAPARFS